MALNVRSSIVRTSHLCAIVHEPTLEAMSNEPSKSMSAEITLILHLGTGTTGNGIRILGTPLDL